jgi:hypothetical protein
VLTELKDNNDYVAKDHLLALTRDAMGAQVAKSFPEADGMVSGQVRLDVPGVNSFYQPPTASTIESALEPFLSEFILII